MILQIELQADVKCPLERVGIEAELRIPILELRPHGKIIRTELKSEPL